MLINAKQEVWAKLKARYPEIELKPRSEVDLEDFSRLMKRGKVSSLSASHLKCGLLLNWMVKTGTPSTLYPGSGPGLELRWLRGN